MEDHAQQEEEAQDEFGDLGTYGQADEVIAADEHRRRGSLMTNPQLQAFVSQQSAEPQVIAVAEEEESKEVEEEAESPLLEETVVVAAPKPVMVSTSTQTAVSASTSQFT